MHLRSIGGHPWVHNSTNKWCGARFGMLDFYASRCIFLNVAHQSQSKPFPAWLISSVAKAIPISSLLLGRAAHFNNRKPLEMLKEDV